MRGSLEQNNRNLSSRNGVDPLNKKASAHAAAVIEIGSNDVRMQVAQLKKGGGGAVDPLDYLSYPLRLGHDVFETGKVSFDSLLELSAILDKFSAALLSYNIPKPRVISTSAMREAANRSLVVDQIRVRNDLAVTVLEDSQEKAYLYAEIISRLSGSDSLKNGDTVLCYVGTGSIGVAVWDGEKICFFQNVSMGNAKLHDILQGMHRSAEDFHVVVEEYLDTILNRISLQGFSIANLVLCGSQIELVAKLCGAKEDSGVFQFGTGRLSELYLSLRSLTPETIGLRYGLSEAQAAFLYTALSIYRAMLRFCPGAKLVTAPVVDISGAVLHCLLSPKADSERQLIWKKSALACAETTARRFGCDLGHSAAIMDYGDKIFDKLKKIHGLDPSCRLILELAAILHSCGSFVSVRRHNRCTFDLIKGMDLFGLSEEEVLQAAFVAGSVSTNLTEDSDADFSRLSGRDKLLVSKLSAIFQLANAMDKSHKAKFKDMRVVVEEDRILFKVSAKEDSLLEQWAFGEAARFFTEVFGLSPQLQVKFQLQ